jgi:kinesin family protein 4/21/27
MQEDVRDLLFTDNHAPRPVVTIREMPSGVSLAGAVEREVHSQEEMALLLEQGSVCRAVASTNMNHRSSRSHAIFTITLEQRKQLPLRSSSDGGALVERGGASSEEDSEADEGLDDSGDDYLIAKMHLVDLAGSERAKRTGAEGARLKEAININKGLLALAKVISALVDNHNHVPYR